LFRADFAVPLMFSTTLSTAFPLLAWMDRKSHYFSRALQLMT
jgi:hypothetical protein